MSEFARAKIILTRISDLAPDKIPEEKTEAVREGIDLIGEFIEMLIPLGVGIKIEYEIFPTEPSGLDTTIH